MKKCWLFSYWSFTHQNVIAHQLGTLYLCTPHTTSQSRTAEMISLDFSVSVSGWPRGWAGSARHTLLTNHSCHLSIQHTYRQSALLPGNGYIREQWGIFGHGTTAFWTFATFNLLVLTLVFSGQTKLYCKTHGFKYMVEPYNQDIPILLSNHWLSTASRSL